MTEFRLLLCLFLVLITASSLASAQAGPTAPVTAPARVGATPPVTHTPAVTPAPTIPVTLPVLQAQDQLDALTVQGKDLQIRSKDLYQQFLATPEVKTLQGEIDVLNPQIQAARKKLDDAKTEALKASGGDPEKEELTVTRDPTGNLALTVIPKPALPSRPHGGPAEPPAAPPKAPK
jgi:hypothetical protein